VGGRGDEERPGSGGRGKEGVLTTRDYPAIAEIKKKSGTGSGLDNGKSWGLYRRASCAKGKGKPRTGTNKTTVTPDQIEASRPLGQPKVKTTGKGEERPG